MIYRSFHLSQLTLLWMCDVHLKWHHCNTSTKLAVLIQNVKIGCYKLRFGLILYQFSELPHLGVLVISYVNKFGMIWINITMLFHNLLWISENAIDEYTSLCLEQNWFCSGVVLLFLYIQAVTWCTLIIQCISDANLINDIGIIWLFVSTQQTKIARLK